MGGGVNPTDRPQLTLEELQRIAETSGSRYRSVYETRAGWRLHSGCTTGRRSTLGEEDSSWRATPRTFTVGRRAGNGTPAPSRRTEPGLEAGAGSPGRNRATRRARSIPTRRSDCQSRDSCFRYIRPTLRREFARAARGGWVMKIVRAVLEMGLILPCAMSSPKRHKHAFESSHSWGSNLPIEPDRR